MELRHNMYQQIDWPLEPIDAEWKKIERVRLEKVRDNIARQKQDRAAN